MHMEGHFNSTGMKRRACGALLRDGKVLMVRHAHDGFSYWTLPGGGVEAEESFEAAVVREVREETGLNVAVERLLWEGETGQLYEKIFLLSENEAGKAALGLDPELAPQDQILKEIHWFTLQEMRGDLQISKLIEIMELDI